MTNPDLVDRISVLVVHNRYRQRGGEDVVFEAEAALLEEEGHTVHRLVVDNAELNDPTGIGEHLRLARNTIWSVRAARMVQQAIRRAKPDLVHAHNTFPLISPSIYDACREAGVPVIHTLHNFRMVCPKATLFRNSAPCEDCVGRRVAWPGIVHACYQDSRPRTAVVTAMLAVQRSRDALEHASGFIAPSQFARELLVRGGLPSGRLFVKPNMVHPDPGGRRDDSGRFVFAGRLSVDKGVDTLLRAWRLLPRTMYLDVVGDGPLRDSAREAAASLPNVTFAGELGRARVLDAMRRARAVIVPSGWYEVAPLTVLEAYANAAPVIASDLGSLREMVIDGETGLRFPPGDPSGLAERVRELASDAELAHRLGARAREEYVARYSGAENYRHLRRIYGSVLEQAASARQGEDLRPA
jgi:glycosyltransferase involved in cell wall biosynthesis